ncbi:MAG: nucleotidyltransferase domain-containing protein [Phycisphaerales bacterium]|jgi:predicted nucleotidyltransferase|nr:nucleotidyltransferase domain-containing protein [Phycisphaerales bacterium]
MIELVRSNLDAIRELCKQHRVARLYLVGSAATGEFDAERSDIDFVVVFEPHEPQGFDDVFFRLLADLESLLHRPVDLIEAHTLRNPYLIASINRTKRMLYAA